MFGCEKYRGIFCEILSVTAMDLKIVMKLNRNIQMVLGRCPSDIYKRTAKRRWLVPHEPHIRQYYAIDGSECGGLHQKQAWLWEPAL